MSFTYTGPNNVGVFATALDEVRFLSEDTVETVDSVSDEEITYLLTQFSVNLSAALAVERRAGKYSLKASSQRSSLKVGDLSIGKMDYVSASTYLYDLAAKLRSGGVQNDGTPSIVLSTGGVEPAESVFYIGQDDYTALNKERRVY